MRWLMTLWVVSLLVLVGCANRTEPFRPREGSKDGVLGQPPSSFYDPKYGPRDVPPSLWDRPPEEIEAFRERHRW